MLVGEVVDAYGVRAGSGDAFGAVEDRADRGLADEPARLPIRPAVRAWERRSVTSAWVERCRPGVMRRDEEAGRGGRR